MATYQYRANGIIRDGGTVIPLDPKNSDYQDYLRWSDAGGTTLPAASEAPAAISVTPWQIRKALNATGLRAAVEAAVLASDLTTQDAWQYATEFVRTDPLVVGLSLALGKTEAELDAVFNLALAL